MSISHSGNSNHFLSSQINQSNHSINQSLSISNSTSGPFCPSVFPSTTHYVIQSFWQLQLLYHPKSINQSIDQAITTYHPDTTVWTSALELTILVRWNGLWSSAQFSPFWCRCWRSSKAWRASVRWATITIRPTTDKFHFLPPMYIQISLEFTAAVRK